MTDTLAPNMREVAATTAGISRNLSIEPLATPPGGGDMNGTSATSILQGHAGTGCDRLSVPRQAIKIGGGNYCGVV